mgnify:CR=1 FL=1
MARSRFGRGAIDPTDGSVNVMPAGFEVLYVTNASTDPLFPAGNNQAEASSAGDRSHDNADNGSDAERLANCRSLVSHRDDSNIATTRLGKAVRPKTLADW